MKKLIEHLKPFHKDEGHVNVVVETPKGSRVKFSYDEDSGFFILSKALPEGMVFPFNFGFIPQTLADDGDPLDVLVLNEEPLIAGCLLKVRPIAVIEATQTEKKKEIRNDRIVGEAIGKEVPEDWRAAELTKQTLSQIELFFKTYNRHYGKRFKVIGTGGPKKARRLIEQAIKMREREGE
jgi:inorganic pyrophosphatase